MKVKTSDLIGPALDWAVAKCEGYSTIRCGAGPSRFLAYIPPNKRSHYKWRPSTSWTQGGPIIDQLTRRGLRIHGMKCRYRTDETSVNVDVNGHYAMSGPNILIAAMRCYVASHLGDEVEIPKELL